MKIGVLALQGAVGPHVEKIQQLGGVPVEVRVPTDLSGLAGMIFPGGESSTMLHLLRLNHLWEPLAGFVREKPVLGLCAGAILLAKTVTSPAQESFGAIDIEIQRNGYGRQSESFIDRLTPTADWPGALLGTEPIEGVFIRAPRITRMASGVEVLIRHGEEPVMVKQGRTLAATFHPELTDSARIHKLLFKICEEQGG